MLFESAARDLFYICDLISIDNSETEPALTWKLEKLSNQVCMTLPDLPPVFLE